jgi:MYXO-CTERM domain-containing protein
MKTRLSILLACAVTVSCVADAERDQIDRTEQAVSCPPKLAYYPVRGKHNHGYDKTAGNSSLWTCGSANSNSDFVAGDHIGNDIWAAEGTPVVATTNGKLTLVGFSSYSGNKVTIIDDCGYYHFFCHLQKLAPGLSNGARIAAGTVIGYVGKTGTASNGVVHLHYSIYPDGNYNAGVNPWSYCKAVEVDVCSIPGSAPPPPACTPTPEVCNGKDDDCDGKVDEDGVCAVSPVDVPPGDVTPVEAVPPNAAPSDPPTVDPDDPADNALAGSCSHSGRDSNTALALLVITGLALLRRR